MKNKPAYICFYLETYTYIALKGNDLLVTFQKFLYASIAYCFRHFVYREILTYFLKSACVFALKGSKEVVKHLFSFKPPV